MPRFLAVYTMKPEDLARFRAMPQAEQKAVDEIGLKHWTDWEKANAASFPDRGGMVGKTKRVTKDGVSEAQNAICGYIVVKAATPPRGSSRGTRTSPSSPAMASISCRLRRGLRTSAFHRFTETDEIL